MKELLTFLRKNGFHLNVVNDELEVYVPKNTTHEKLFDQIKKEKERIVRFIRSNRKDFIFLPIDKAPETVGYQLSSSQRRLWILSQLDEHATAYNMPSVFEIKGKLNPDLIADAFCDLMKRHEILRTSFVEDPEEDVIQVIHSIDESRSIFLYEDLSHLPDSNDVVEGLINQNTQYIFNLSEGPLFRSILIKRADEDYLLAFTLHHIISDGWSSSILIRDLLSIYNCKINKASLNLPEMPIQYKDYAYWQQLQLKNNSFESHKEYWLNQLSGDLPVFDLPGYQIRPTVKTYNGSVVKVLLTREKVLRLANFCNNNGATVFMGLVACLHTLLFKYTHQKGILLGTPVAGRDHPDMENQIGFYVNTIVLKIESEPTLCFKELLQTVKKVCLDAYANQSYPFDKLVDDLSLKRDISRNVLFDVMVSFGNKISSKVNIEGLEVNNYIQRHTTSKFDLAFDFLEISNGELLLNLEYNTDIYDQGFVEKMGDHFEVVLDQVTQNEETPLQEIDCLTLQERDLILQDFNFNSHSSNHESESTFIDLFYQQAEKTPDHVAISCSGRKITYKELNELSNQLGLYLKNKYNILTDDLVAIKLVRNEWMVISILAILKAGAAYLPIDPAYPEERVLYMEEHSRCKVLLDEKELEIFKSKETLFSKENLNVIIRPDQLAYVIYTSGSTGKPKGVMIEHAGMLNHLDAMINTFGLNEHSRVAQNASCTFDISVWQLLNALMVGGTTVIYNNDVILNPEHFWNSLAEDGITILQIVPSYMSALLEIFDNEKISSIGLTYLLVTGEAVSKEIIEKWFTLFPTVKVVNAYGPAEAADDVSFFIMDKAPDSNNVSIGRPIQNIKIYILDQFHNLCPIGVEGELYVSGIGVGRGYLNDVERTKNSFLADPFDSSQTARMYKTGDLGRWMSDGNIAFTGRKDNQVKVRGFRIELEEIESALLNYQAIKEAVVVARSDAEGTKYLVGYIVSEEIEMDDLRFYLNQTLPEYMVPNYFIKMESIPLNPNGKIDRNALPDPESSFVLGRKEFVGARNEIEVNLSGIWANVLNKNDLSVKENFFEVGGNSLKAIKLIKLIGNIYPLINQVHLIFSYPTIEKMAEHISSLDKQVIQEDRYINVDF